MAHDRKVIRLRFNQDHGCFSSCMESGLRIFNIDPLAEKSFYNIQTIGSVSQCEMLFRTNIFAIVAGGSRPKFLDNKVLIYDDHLKKFIMELVFGSPVMTVKMRSDKLIVALLNQIHVFSFPSPTERLFTVDTRTNFRGLCEVTPLTDAERQILAFPGHKTGSVQLIDLKSNEMRMSNAPVWIGAHQSDLCCIALNQQGTRLATASQKGTLIRVWDTHTRNQLIELRRGSDCATLYCINFSIDSDYLCCSSDKGTVHIFAIKKAHLNKKLTIPSGGILGKYGESQWGLANFTVPPESACICAFGANKTVVAICLDGTFHKYTFKDDGICSRKGYDVYLDICDDEEDFQ